jgi:hypothetical protein
VSARAPVAPSSILNSSDTTRGRPAPDHDDTA